MKKDHLEVFIEFFIFGILMGVVEDLIVLTFIAKEPITWGIIFITIVIAIPFAVIGELIVDRVEFFKKKPKSK